jgi:hypothetical protein
MNEQMEQMRERLDLYMGKHWGSSVRAVPSGDGVRFTSHDRDGNEYRWATVCPDARDSGIWLVNFTHQWVVSRRDDALFASLLFILGGVDE